MISYVTKINATDYEHEQYCSTVECYISDADKLSNKVALYLTNIVSFADVQVTLGDTPTADQVKTFIEQRGTELFNANKDTLQMPCITSV